MGVWVDTEAEDGTALIPHLVRAALGENRIARPREVVLGGLIHVRLGHPGAGFHVGPSTFSFHVQEGLLEVTLEGAVATNLEEEDGRKFLF